MNMNTRNLFKNVTLVLATIATGLVATTAAVSAIPYDAARTNASPVPAFNVFTGVPDGVGDESDFLRARETKVATAPYVDPLSATCKDGEKIQMRVYIHNGASTQGNNNGNGPSVAKDVRVKVDLPAAAAATFSPTATISASNAVTVNDNTTINCNGKKVKLNYVAGSAAQSSKGTGRVALGDEIVTNGVAIRGQATAGSVYGCWDETVYVVLTVVVEEIVEPVVEQKPVVATCDMFRITAGDNRTIRVSDFKYTATNATYKNTILNWDAGKTNVSTTAITDPTKVVGQTYQYAANGTYLVTATVRFTNTVDNKEIVASTANCQQKVTFTDQDQPVVTPVTPVTLVAAGAGSTIALFAAVAIAGTVLYHLYSNRRIV